MTLNMFVVVDQNDIQETLVVCENRQTVDETLLYFMALNFSGSFTVFDPGTDLPEEVYSEALYALERMECELS